MKQRQILIRAFLVILCLPLSACLFNVSGGTSGVKYPIDGDGVVNLTSLTELESLKLGGINAFQSKIINVSLECKSPGGLFIPIQDSNFTLMAFKLNTPLEFWSLVKANCGLQEVDANYSIELALRLGDKYAPIFTEGNFNCLVQAIFVQQKTFLSALEFCVASDPRLPRPSTNKYGVNVTVQGINVLTLLVPQAAI